MFGHCGYGFPVILGAMSAMGQAQRKQDFGPFVEGFVEFTHCTCYRCPHDKTYGNCDIKCAKKVEDVILKEGADTIGGMIVEPITAGGGVLMPVKEYYPILQKICRKYDIWMIMDEVVCVFGRTGIFWGQGLFAGIEFVTEPPRNPFPKAKWHSSWAMSWPKT